MRMETTSNETTPLQQKSNHYSSKYCTKCLIALCLIVVAIIGIYKSDLFSTNNSSQWMKPNARFESDDLDIDKSIDLSADHSTSNCDHDNDKFDDGTTFGLVIHRNIHSLLFPHDNTVMFVLCIL